MPKNEPMGAEVSFETAMERLEKIVEEMESSKLPLEELLVRYEEGIRLVGVCNQRLAGAENRIEIELTTGKVIRLRGQGAGRWPTAVSVMGDLHEVARIVESGR